MGVVGSLGREGDEGSLTPFIGREDELGLLRQLFARTLRERSVQVVTITGEPGVGKTRLVGEFRARSWFGRPGTLW